MAQLHLKVGLDGHQVICNWHMDVGQQWGVIEPRGVEPSMVSWPQTMTPYIFGPQAPRNTHRPGSTTVKVHTLGWNRGP